MNIHRLLSSLRLLGTCLGILLTGTAVSGASEYRVGPGKPYTTLGAVPWTHLVPGDTVAISWRPQAYHEKILLTNSGTAAHPIRIYGVAGPQGQLPVLDGQNATTSAQFQFPYAPTQDRGLVIVSISKQQGWGHKPSYIEIASLEAA